MNKKTATLAVLSALLLTANAQASEFDGFYAGGRVGVNRSDITGPLVASDKGTTTWGIDEGYNWDMDSFLLGAAFYVDVNHKADHTAPARGYSISAMG